MREKLPPVAGVRILKGTIAAALPIGLGVAVECAVAPQSREEGSRKILASTSAENVTAAKVRGHADRSGGPVCCV